MNCSCPSSDTVVVSWLLWQEVGQTTHVLAGLLVILGPIALFGARFWYVWALALVLFASVKEFWYDENYETADERGSNLEDFGFYMVGLVVGILLYKIKVWFKGETIAWSAYKPIH